MIDIQMAGYFKEGHHRTFVFTYEKKTQQCSHRCTTPVETKETQKTG